jgi:hypothetical protein
MSQIKQDEYLCCRSIDMFVDDCRSVDSWFHFTQAKYVFDLLFRQIGEIHKKEKGKKGRKKGDTSIDGKGNTSSVARCSGFCKFFWNLSGFQVIFILIIFHSVC